MNKKTTAISLKEKKEIKKEKKLIKPKMNVTKKTLGLEVLKKKQTKNKVNFPSQKDIDQTKTRLKDLVEKSKNLHPDNEVRKWVEKLILVLSNPIKDKSGKVALKLKEDLDDLKNELKDFKKKRGG